MNKKNTKDRANPVNSYPLPVINVAEASCFGIKTASAPGGFHNSKLRIHNSKFHRVAKKGKKWRRFGQTWQHKNARKPHFSTKNEENT
ncbi:MAG: hypothetical protein ABFR90_12155 [Planctomycetota bacterium]